MSTKLFDEKTTFVVWSSDRTRKKSFRCSRQVDVVIVIACEKLCVVYSSGMKLVLEADGTEIDDDEILSDMSTRTLMLLGPHEHWTSGRPAADGDARSGRPGSQRSGAGGQHGHANCNHPDSALVNSLLDNQCAMQQDLTRMVLQTQALQLYDRQEKREARRESNNRSLMLAAAGGAAMVGGAACAVAAAPVVAAVGAAALIGGAVAEVIGLGGYLKTA